MADFTVREEDPVGQLAGIVFYSFLIGPILLACAGVIVIFYPAASFFSVAVGIAIANLAALVGRVLVPLWISGGSCCTQQLSDVPFLPDSPGSLILGAIISLLSFPVFFVIESWIAERKSYWWGRCVWRVVLSTLAMLALLGLLFSTGNITAFGRVSMIIGIMVAVFVGFWVSRSSLKNFETSFFRPIRAVMERRLAKLRARLSSPYVEPALPPISTEMVN